MYYSFIYTQLHFMVSICVRNLFKVSVWDLIHLPSDCCWSCDTHKMFDAGTKHLSTTVGQLKVFLGPFEWRYLIFKSPSCAFTSVTMLTHQNVSKYSWHKKSTWCFLYLFFWPMICQNQFGVKGNNVILTNPFVLLVAHFAYYPRCIIKPLYVIKNYLTSIFSLNIIKADLSK